MTSSEEQLKQAKELADIMKSVEEMKGLTARGITLVEKFVGESVLKEGCSIGGLLRRCLEVEPVSCLWHAHQNLLLHLIENTLGPQQAMLWSLQAKMVGGREMVAMACCIAAAYDLGLQAGKEGALKAEWRDPAKAASVLLGTLAPEEEEE